MVIVYKVPDQPGLVTSNVQCLTKKFGQMCSVTGALLIQNMTQKG